jgi:hypothetical protein
MPFFPNRFMIKKLILTILLASISGMLWAREQRTQKSIDSLKHKLAVAKTDSCADNEGAEFIVQLPVN